MYWELVINDMHDGDSLLTGISKTKEDLELDFDDGVEIGNINYDLSDFIIEEGEDDSIIGRVTDYIAISDLGGIVFSQEARILFDGLSVNNIQYIPTQLNGANNKYLEKKYFIANVIGIVDCINYELSDLDIEDGHIDNIFSLVLNENKIADDIEIFRLHGKVLTILVSETLKNAIEKSELTGFIFRNIKTQEIVPASRKIN